MNLIIGGCSQGKLNYALKMNKSAVCAVWDGELPPDSDTDKGADIIIVDHFHQWIKECMKNGGCPEKEVREFIKKYPDCIIISDEIGNGIVPADAFEREYRERTGRILVELADKALEVVRVICGIGQKIK